MVAIGKVNELEIVKEVDFGIFLDGEEFGEILLPKRFVPENYEIGDKITVFLYVDSEDRPIATTARPIAMAGQLAYLKVVSTTNIGAFMDWGLPKDLLLPFSSQKDYVKKDEYHVVQVRYDDASERMVATTKIGRFIEEHPFTAEKGDKVELMIGNQTEIGWQVVVNYEALGMVYNEDACMKLRPGMKLPGYIKKVREDGKADVALKPLGYVKVKDAADDILNLLKKNNGFIAATSKSSPAEIKRIFGQSKKAWKMAIGKLYKRRQITIEDDGIHLVEEE